MCVLFIILLFYCSCWLVLFSVWQKAAVSSENIENVPPSHWPEGKSLRHFLDWWLMWKGPASPLWVAPLSYWSVVQHLFLSVYVQPPQPPTQEGQRTTREGWFSHQVINQEVRSAGCSQHFYPLSHCQLLFLRFKFKTGVEDLPR